MKKNKKIWIGIGGVLILLILIFLLPGTLGDSDRHGDSQNMGVVDATQKAENQAMGESKNDRVVCEDFAVFSGHYVEDGSDEMVENVAAALITNRSKEYLDLATLTYDIDGKEAVFVVTGLPAGESAWVMEAHRMTITKESEITYKKCEPSFREDVLGTTNRISVEYDGDKLRVTNESQEMIEDIFLCYKRVNSDGSYLGGITYRVDVGTLDPGETVRCIAGHYVKNETKIVRIGWRTE